MTERDLIQHCLANDRNAQRRLYEQYKKGMDILRGRPTGIKPTPHTKAKILTASKRSKR